jgi:DNA invertase Pin-like site-specific DNA recombinase
LTDVIDEHDVVIATRLDRFSRSAQDLLSTIPILEEVGIQLFFCEQFGDMPVVHKKRPKVHGLDQRFDMNDMVNKIMLMVLSAVAEIEHANIRDRFGDGKIDWASRGYYIGGGVPYGWRPVEEKHGNKKRVRLEEVPEEQEWIKVIHKLRKRGRGLKYIAKELNSLQNDKEWHYRQVEKVLKPRKYQAVSTQH